MNDQYTATMFRWHDTTHEGRWALGATTNQSRISTNVFMDEEADTEGLRQRICKMSNPELLLFGVTAKFLCSLEANLNQPPPECVRVRLSEARAEWNRRNPTLPLSDSF